MSFSCAAELLSDEFHKRFWTEETQRHIKLRITVVNDGAETKERVRFRLLVPEDLVHDFSGDNWAPCAKEEVNGTMYDVWENFGGTAIIDGVVYGTATLGATAGGMSMVAGARYRNDLGLNLKPYADSITLLMRVFEDEDPASNFLRETIALTPYKPSL